MRPNQPDPTEPDDLFRARLSQQIDRRHPLVRLAGPIDWEVFEARFGELYHPHVGRPGIPIRLMVGLSYLQHTFALSDEAVVARWVENPYFCGCDYLQLALPIDPSSLVRWRQRIGQDGIELLLQETIAAAERGEAVREQSLERISVDTTVQPKAIADPLDSRLYHRGRETYPGNPSDGQTLVPALDQVERLTGVAPKRCYADRGYRGHGVSGETTVFVAGRRRGTTPTIRRELRRRSAIEAMIGHMKLDGRLARNHLKGAVGDAIHALLCGAGHNLRLILRHLERLLRALLRLLAADPRADSAAFHSA
jgi:IS5 family transposase